MRNRRINETVGVRYEDAGKLTVIIDDVRRIAKNGWEKGHRDFNERIVTSYFLDIAINRFPKGNYPWPMHQYFK